MTDDIIAAGREPVTTCSFHNLFARHNTALATFAAHVAVADIEENRSVEAAYLAAFDAVTRAEPETPADLAHLIDLLIGEGGAPTEEQEAHLRAMGRKVASRSASPVPRLLCALGGDLSLGADGKVWRGQPEPWTLAEVPNPPDAKPHQCFQSADEWTGAMKLLDYLFTQMGEGERREVRDAVAAAQTPGNNR